MLSRTLVAALTTATAVAAVVPSASACEAVPAQERGPVAADVRVEATVWNDPRRGSQWALSTLGGETLRSKRSARGVVVAVIDSGVQGNHPDLAGRIVPGYDFTTSTPGGAVDGYGHGTHIAGLIAANANNRTGVAGLAPDASIMPLRVLDNNGAGWGSNVAKALRFAADRGAKVANVSLASSYSQPIADAVRYAQSKGVVVVAAVGNYRLKGNATTYPAALPGVIGVAAVDSSSGAASFSNTGSYVDIAAPGVGVVSTYKNSGYVSMSGTSMAAPYVAAAVAVLKSARPTLTGDQALSVLASTARDLGPRGRDARYGAGVIRPVNAVCSVVRC